MVLFVVIGIANASSRTGTVSTPPPAGAAAAADPGAAAQQPAGVATFGQRYTWQSGLAVEVAAPQGLQAVEHRRRDDRGRAVLVTATVVNGTDEPYDFNYLIFGPTAVHDGRTASSIIDITADVGVTPVTTILPGKSFTYSTALSIGPAQAERQFQFTADFAGERAIFVDTV